MPLMQPQQQPQPNTPANIGSSEQDGMQGMQPPQGAAPGMTPSAPTNVGSSEPDTGPSAQGQDQNNPATQAIQQRLDALPDHDKKFLSQYLTPEFVYAIGLVSGPEAAQYLGQFTDQNKVLVPVSRQEAARIQQTVQQDQSQQGGQPGAQPAPQQPQGQSQPAPQQAQGAPMMKPQPMPQQAQAQLPNGVTPAPMQHGIMAPRA